MFVDGSETGRDTSLILANDLSTSVGLFLIAVDGAGTAGGDCIDCCMDGCIIFDTPILSPEGFSMAAVV